MTKKTGKARSIDWSTAEVSDGTLTVKLDGKASRKWVEHLESVLDRLAGHGGGASEIEVKPSKVTLSGVMPGKEDEVRHLLESAIHQVNTDLGGGDSDEDGDEDRAEPDREMTEVFRAFASREG